MTGRGAAAEETALRFLLGQGLQLRARNYRCRLGEIDLILEHGDTIVFVEVRQRRSLAYGGAAESIDARKRSRLVATARHFLAGRRCTPPCRFDAILVGPGGEVQWIRGAFGE
ncbi:MAG: YraN family protein [Burkholderiales bacterium]|nr:YraN family protein [Burkholderiales bacterium]